MTRPTEWTFQIEGMTCEHCARSIEKALERVPGVTDPRVRYEDARGTVTADPSVSPRTLAAAVSGAGGAYRVVDIVSAAATQPTRRDSPADTDLLVIGSGSAGFAAAIRGAELGRSVAIVEAGTLGGTCVNIGCVPSKTLIRAAEAIHRTGHHGFAGFRPQIAPVDFGAIVRQKDDLVAQLRKAKYEDVLGSYPSIRLIPGRAALEADGTVRIDGSPVRASRTIIATGARPWIPPIPGLAGTTLLTSTEALSLAELPKRLVVVGGSAVGLEFAQLFARMGSKVTLLEALPRIAPAEDSEISEALANYLREEGIDVQVGARIRAVSGTPGAHRIAIESDGRSSTLEADRILIATGRRANTGGLGLEEAGVLLGNKGEVLVNEYLESSRAGIYAAGDVAGDPMFVYVAAHAGSVAAENALLGNRRRLDIGVLPRVTFTDPAIASVGFTEAQARARATNIIVARLPMSHVPRAIAARDTRGLIKLVADATSRTLLGAHILAPEAGEMIQEAALMIRFGIRIDDIASMLHPYLTDAEGIRLACQTFDKDIAKLSCCAS